MVPRACDAFLTPFAVEKVSLEHKPDHEVLALMKHREEDMRAKAANEINERLRSPDANPVTSAILKDKLQSDPRLLGTLTLH